MASSNVDTASSSTRKRKSYIWTYFSTYDERVANCDLCGNKIKTAGNTTNMIKVFLL